MDRHNVNAAGSGASNPRPQDQPPSTPAPPPTSAATTARRVARPQNLQPGTTVFQAGQNASALPQPRAETIPEQANGDTGPGYEIDDLIPEALRSPAGPVDPSSEAALNFDDNAGRSGTALAQQRVDDQPGSAWDQLFAEIFPRKTAEPASSMPGEGSQATSDRQPQNAVETSPQPSTSWYPMEGRQETETAGNESGSVSNAHERSHSGPSTSKALFEAKNLASTSAFRESRKPNPDGSIAGQKRQGDVIAAGTSKTPRRSSADEVNAINNLPEFKELQKKLSFEIKPESIRSLSGIVPPKEIISIIGRKTSALNALIGWSERISAFTNISTILRGAGIQTETTLEKLLETVETQKETLDKLDNLVRHSWRGPAFGSLSAMLSGAGSRGPAALNDVLEILAGKMDLLSKLEKLVGSGKGHSAFSSIARVFYSAGATTPERLPGFLNVLEKREAALVELVGPGKMFPDFGRFLSNLPEGRGGAAHRLEKLIASSLPSASKSAVPSDKTGTF